jgi:Uma2 family endonuclease
MLQKIIDFVFTLDWQSEYGYIRQKFGVSFLFKLLCKAKPMATTIAPRIKRPRLYPEERLPESDGKPMAETDAHRDQMVYLLDALREYFRDDPQVYVTGNIFLYYRDDTKTRQSVSPDIFVVRGVKKKSRRIYNLDVERKAPDVVIELTSPNTKTEDLGTKRFIYASLGVKEYFLFDPYSEAIRPALAGFRLGKGEYVPMVGARLTSEVLGLHLVIEDDWLRLYDRETGERLRTHEESEAERRSAEKKAAKAVKAYQAAESEILRLRDELAKLRGK